MKQPTTEDLAATRDQLRAEIREARETLKDLRYEIRTARELAASTKDLAATLAAGEIKAALTAQVDKQIEKLGAVTEQTMSKSVAKVTAEFDKLRDLLLGQEHVADGREEHSIPELLQNPEILAHAQHAARRNTTRKAGHA